MLPIDKHYNPAARAAVLILLSLNDVDLVLILNKTQPCLLFRFGTASRGV
jgi:hypothetical protein